MLDYLKAKVADYAIILSWADRELKDLQKKSPDHHQLIARLLGKLNEAQALRTHIQIIVNIGHPTLIARALPIIHDIEFWTIIITCYYLPALRREDNEDRAFRNLLLPTAARCGLYWIEDIAVRLDGVQATVSVLTETPVIFAPPQHSVSLLDMAGIYHELGHNVFRRFPDIAENLATVIADYFEEFRHSAGPMGPNQLAERNRAIDEAQKYWNVERLDEIFCDIYATFVCGPAHYFSCVDMAFRAGDVFQVKEVDVHPPPAARVYVCDKSLAPAYQEEPFVVSTRNVWNAHLNTLNQNAEFELVCASPLLDRVVDAAIESILRLLPGARHYDEPLPADSDMEKIPEYASLESILNRGAKILFMKPDCYADWEKTALRILKS